MKWCNWIQGNRFMENTVRPDRRGETEFDKQVATMRAWLLKKGWHKALAAMEFAKETHVGQRGGGEPEFSHQLFIAFYIITIEKLLMFPEETVCVAFLHDIHEDYDTSREELVRRFGEMVAASTITISKVRDGVRILDAQYYKEMEEDPIASVVKGVDRPHNLHTMGFTSWSIDKRQAYVDFTFDKVLPMLKAARRRFPQQEPAYQNLKSLILMQTRGIQLALDHERAADLVRAPAI